MKLTNRQFAQFQFLIFPIPPNTRTNQAAKNMPDYFVKQKLLLFVWNSIIVFSPLVELDTSMVVGLNEKESASLVFWSTVTPAADLQSSRPQFQNPGRDDHSRDAGRHDCQLKQVILWSYMDTGPTSQRQYAAFLKLIALQNLDFICKTKNQLL